MRRASIAIVTLLLLRGMLSVQAEAEARRPLDLPSGGFGTSEEDEDASETIRFYGSAYEGEAFFFLLDVSGSMRGLKIEQLKEELHSSIASLSARTEFGMVRFSTQFELYDRKPARATSTEKVKARNWISEIEPDGNTYMLRGALQIISVAHKSRLRHRVIIVVGDGLPTTPPPEETLAGILAANKDALPWNTILVGQSRDASEFMRALADTTGGTYRHFGD